MQSFARMIAEVRKKERTRLRGATAGQPVQPLRRPCAQNLTACTRTMDRLACTQGFPAWQVLLVDLRCHGESALLPTSPSPPHTVASAAKDVLGVLRQLRLFPQ